ncbi:phosphoenolpyruvate--protein phosphotransferase [Salinivibrio kushneri]|uniref:phosphoenolpyruvate--protein phosphotransferase n=1 Tax=Salinivibrio kushneri TaxID=1908198 RepID=UPI00098789FD|nr:phosphoenolpyruvate--protein phosphotransferase [Salinivibrio kushneri]OOE49581.1 phosphoenolpyruvate--protein phosphotransferase [Salinivibrio kushneri]OOE51612.1 phosphoenolpyruvate--protein phosphotransferase [Salinivibrio kushneri]OOE60855.1 phosphoenolpyruvate--protein phosphotransferase [Salinivibrio kushneri]
MVGIVVVSHSRRLAEGVAELATQMTQGKANIAIAAGVDDPENPIGTDTIAVMEAIERVNDEKGVIVLMDLGSALLSAEMALDLLDDQIKESVTLISAPIVEGTMAASVAAAAGLPMVTVVEEAQNALGVKQAHLGDQPSTNAEPAQTAKQDKEALTYDWIVQNPHGLHARPAAAIVGALARFDCQLWLQKGDRQVNAKSLNSIAKLGVRCNETITIHALGSQAVDAIAAFKALAHDHFGEKQAVDDGALEHQSDEVDALQYEVNAQTIEGAITGVSVNEGIVTAPVVLLTSDMPSVPDRPFGHETDEIAHVKQAIECVVQRLQRQAKQAKGDIFSAHSMMLSDPELWQSVESHIQSGMIAEQAWLETLHALAEEYRHAETLYMREREADVHDIARQVMIEMTGAKPQAIEIQEPSILLAHDLMPSDVAGFDKEKVVGICLSEGGKTSHSAILARAMGIPAMVKAQGCLDAVRSGQMVTLDGFKGHLWFAPSDEIQQALDAQKIEWQNARKSALASAQQVAMTRDGIAIPVLANIGGPNDLENALTSGAEGVGLFRTEFLFQDSEALPTEDEQYQVYRDIAAALGDKPLTIRSLDVGGDKPLAAYPMPEEDNPFLGLRGVRLCLKHEALFNTQLRAILKAFQVQPNIQLMIPMVAQVEEVKKVKALLAHQAQQLGVDASKLPVGIMIEVPAAVLNADALAQEVDFFSIGTNDLTQYVMAADRGNTAVAELVNYFEPSVLKAIELTCAAGERAGIPVSMCGEMAGDPNATQMLLGIGLRKFSASASLLPGLKAQIRQLSLQA